MGLTLRLTLRLTYLLCLSVLCFLTLLCLSLSVSFFSPFPSSSPSSLLSISFLQSLTFPFLPNHSQSSLWFSPSSFHQYFPKTHFLRHFLEFRISPSLPRLSYHFLPFPTESYRPKAVFLFILVNQSLLPSLHLSFCFLAIISTPFLAWPTWRCYLKMCLSLLSPPVYRGL